ncbi:MAG: ABC transporter permease subunit [Mesorhizobium sp.]|nr:MAG: ABC transporter permease subunit [Mesorhizobium sp.]
MKFGKLVRLSLGLTIPAIALLLIVFGIPIVLLFLTSFDAPAFSFGNYRAFFAQPANIRVLVQTIEMSMVATALCLLVGYPAAYLISSASKQIRTVLIVLVVMPYLTSLLARTYAWIVILGDHGLINGFLLYVGLIGSPLPLLYNRFAVYLGMVHIMLPVMMLPLISVMLGINRSLMAAARSMGARPSSAFWRVFFPLSLPGVRSGTLLVFVLCLGFYITPAALGGLRDAMLSSFIAAQVTSSFNLARISAAAFVLLALAVIVLSFVGVDLSGTQERSQTPSTRWSPGRTVGPVVRYLREMRAARKARRWAANLYKAESPDRLSSVFSVLFLAAVIGFLLFPGVIVFIMSFSVGAMLEFPPSGFSLQWYISFFGDPSWNRALVASVEIGIAVAAVSTLFGTLAAYGLNRTGPGLRGLLTMLLLTPITFPIIVVGIAAYMGLIRLGLIGSMTGLILAHSVGSIAYVVVIVSATLANFDRRLEMAARSMKAGPIRTFRRVTLPLIMPGIVGGALFAFINSFDEVVISSLVSGLSIRTLPLKMWENIRHQIDPTIAAIASMLMLLPILWIVAIYITWWRSNARTKPVAVGSVA